MKYLILMCLSWSTQTVQAETQKTTSHTQQLMGRWQLDLTPLDSEDDNFAMMEITAINGSDFSGTFYRPGVAIQHGQINTQLGTVYGALKSADGSGVYHSSFYLKGDQLHGTTHAIDRGFLSVWVATKVEPGSDQPNSSALPRFEPAKSLYDLPDQPRYTFGYLHVAENRSVVDSRAIKIPIYVFKSTHPNPPKDPVIAVTGGPGLSHMRNARWMKFWSYLEDRDVILFDQRGTQNSFPHLSCPEWSQAQFDNQMADLKSHIEETKPPALATHAIQAIKDCRNRLINDGIDLDAYHTEAIAADVEDLRQVLGIQQYNVYAISYGTKVAQILLRDHPQHLRSVVMDSPLPLASNFDEQSVQNLLEAWERIYQACASQTSCAQTYPDLKHQFEAFLTRISADPIPLTADINGKEESVYVRGRHVAQLFSSVSTSDLPQVPSMMNELIQGNYQQLQAHLSQLMPGSGNGLGMRLSVWCAEETPFVSGEVIQNELKKYLTVKGMNPATVDPSVCDLWQVQAADESANQAVRSEVPALIINGEFDHLTPSKWGLSMLDQLPQGFHIELPSHHHNPTTHWDNPCAMNLAKQFLNHPEQLPHDVCLEKLRTDRLDLFN